jgi:uncharacterized membrane protein
MNSTTLNTVHADASLVRLTHVTYGLHAIGLALGVFGAQTVVGAFLGIPSLIALIINYVKRDEARGTWLESHISWQIRTFWWVLAWAIAIVLVSAPLVLLLGLGFVTGWIGLLALGVWAIYRIARGWLRLGSREAMPMTPR